MKSMVIRTCLFSSESVCESHPGTLADGIGDAVLDARLKLVQQARVACATPLADTDVVWAGEVKTRRNADVEEVSAPAPTGAVAGDALGNS